MQRILWANLQLRDRSVKLIKMQENRPLDLAPVVQGCRSQCLSNDGRQTGASCSRELISTLAADEPASPTLLESQQHRHCSAGVSPDRPLPGQADLQVDRLSSSWAASLQMQAIRRVLQLPPSESRNTCVNLLER